MKTPSRINPGTTDVRHMFDRIASRYEMMNRLMSFGRDRSWRKRVLELAAPPANGHLLDVGAGTGSIAREAARGRRDLRIVGCDFSPRMLDIATYSENGERVSWHLADALALPFRGESFDCVVSGYLIRNTGNPAAAFHEQARVLRPGGRLVCLETAPVRDDMLAPAIRLYLRRILPVLGRVAAGGAGPEYAYLGQTTMGFMLPEEMAAIMEEKAGLRVECVERRMFGTQAIIAAVKH